MTGMTVEQLIDALRGHGQREVLVGWGRRSADDLSNLDAARNVWLTSTSARLSVVSVGHGNSADQIVDRLRLLTPGTPVIVSNAVIERVEAGRFGPVLVLTPPHLTVDGVA